MHEPSKLGWKGANHQEILAHPVEKGIGGNSGVARQRGVADKIGPFETLLHRRPAGDARRRVYGTAKEETQCKSLRVGACFGHGISNMRTCAGAVAPIRFRFSRAKSGETRPTAIAFRMTHALARPGSAKIARHRATMRARKSGAKAWHSNAPRAPAESWSCWNTRPEY